MTTTIEVDVLIIGSVAGGGTVADRLARHCASGLRVALAEAGPWYSREHFNMREVDMIGLFKDNGAVPSRSFDISVTAAECVGGSTAVYTGVTFRAPEGLVDGWVKEQRLEELDETDIQGRFERLEQRIDAHFPGRELENENNRIFREGCEALGWPVKQFRLNIKDCKECGFCNLGCPYGAKRGTLEVQVPSAIDQGVELIPNCRIERVFDGGAEGTISAAPAGTRGAAYAPGPVRFNARKVVIAAGALSSSALLLASKLGDLSPTCGHFITLHPALMSFGRMPSEVRGYDGFPKLHYTDQFSDSHHYYIETAFYFPFITAKSLPSFGPELRRFMQSYSHLTCALSLVHDAAEEQNRIFLHRGRPVLDYALSEQSKESILHALRSVGELYFAAGAEEYVSPVSSGFGVRREEGLAGLERTITREAFLSGKVVVNSAHPMGGCRMGASRDNGVTDACGRVFGHPSLVVADASLFPTSSKVNPYLTVMALADRIAEKIEAELVGA